MASFGRWFGESDAWAAAILFDEFDAAGLKGCLDGGDVGGRHADGPVKPFCAADRGNSNPRLDRQGFSRPAQERTSRADLCARHRDIKLIILSETY